MFLELKNSLCNVYHTFLSLIYNEKCIVCNCAKADDFLCKTCAKDVHYLSSYAHKIYDEIPIFSACLYDGTVKKLIQKLKFSHRKKASIPLSKVLFEYFNKIKKDENYIIAFPPSYFLKKGERGYNHMLLIAKEFSKLTEIEVNKNLIKKIKYTKPQYKARNRHNNIKGSFKINKKEIENIKDKTVLLIDDIVTSGATLEEIINCLKKENINNIVCLTISKSIK